MVNRNIVYLIFIVFIFLCMIFFSIKENFAATTIGTDYTSYIKDYYLLNTGNELSDSEKRNLEALSESIPEEEDEVINDPGACMKLCFENSGCNSIKYTKSDGNCVLYKNKPHSNSKQTNIENCGGDDGNVCYYNKNNSIFIPYDDYVETGKKYRKNINHCNPNSLGNKDIAFSFIENNDEYIKQCADACRNTSDCKGFNVINNHDNITNNRENAKFYCQLYNDKCEGGTALTNNMSQNDMFASYDEYTCGDLDSRKNSDNNNYNFYCNNKKIDLLDLSNVNDFPKGETATKKSAIANSSDNYVCLPECNSGGLKNKDNVLIGLKESEFPQFFTL